jgi:hypothetical protein
MADYGRLRYWQSEMTGETDLHFLLAKLEPLLHPEELVFCVFTEDRLAGLRIQPICIFREAEGLTAIVLREEAERLSLPFAFPCKRITLTVHSNLEAVGLLAAAAAKLAAAAISVNVVSAYYHDHLFVRSMEAQRALELLLELQQSARAVF